MKVVIFGAGASYDCGCSYPEKPPLGQGLFDRICDSNKDYLEAKRKYADTFAESFERGVERVRKDPNIDESWLIYAMGNYLRKFSVEANNYYSKYFASLADENMSVAIATTNYDLLIEQSLSALGFSWDYVIPYNSIERWALLKIHGSCNFVPHSKGRTWLSGAQLQGANLSRANLSGIDIDTIDLTGAKLDQTIIDTPGRAIIQMDDLDTWYKKKNPHTPIMAQFERDKTVWVGNQLIKQIQSNYIYCIDNASEIVIIGLAYQPHDNHIWGPIFDAKCRVTIVDPYPSSQLVDWSRKRTDKTELYEIPFSTFVDGLLR